MFWVTAIVVIAGPLDASAQKLLDRVVARVDGFAITLSDVHAAIALGFLDLPPDADERATIARLVEWHLMRAEVARFSPPEPSATELAREVAALKAHLGDRVDAVRQATGLDDSQIQGIARDTLRIRAYLDQRFGTAAQLTEEDVLQYYRIHPEEFTRDGRQIPFGEVEALARARAAAERRSLSVERWIQDLRRRADVVIVRPGP
jgi:hypothetical protein